MCNIYSCMRISTSEERDFKKFIRHESVIQRLLLKLPRKFIFLKRSAHIVNKAWQTLTKSTKNNVYKIVLNIIGNNNNKR